MFFISRTTKAGLFRTVRRNRRESWFSASYFSISCLTSSALLWLSVIARTPHFFLSRLRNEAALFVCAAVAIRDANSSSKSRFELIWSKSVFRQTEYAIWAASCTI